MATELHGIGTQEVMVGAAVPLFKMGSGAAAADVESVTSSAFTPGCSTQATDEPTPTAARQSDAHPTAPAGLPESSSTGAPTEGPDTPALERSNSMEFVLEFGRMVRKSMDTQRELEAAGSRGPRHSSFDPASAAASSTLVASDAAAVAAAAAGCQGALYIGASQRKSDLSRAWQQMCQWWCESPLPFRKCRHYHLGSGRNKRAQQAQQAQRDRVVDDRKVLVVTAGLTVSAAGEVATAQGAVVGGGSPAVTPRKDTLRATMPSYRNQATAPLVPVGATATVVACPMSAPAAPTAYHIQVGISSLDYPRPALLARCAEPLSLSRKHRMRHRSLRLSERERDYPHPARRQIYGRPPSNAQL